MRDPSGVVAGITVVFHDTGISGMRTRGVCPNPQRKVETTHPVRPVKNYNYPVSLA